MKVMVWANFNQAMSFTGEYLSDKNLAEGWYGFTYQGKLAVASTDCIKVKKQQSNV